MPFIIPFIPLIAAGISTGVPLIERAVAGGGGGAAPTVPQPQTAATNQAQTAAATQALPTLQSMTGGSVSPEYAAQFAGTTTGLGNNPAAAGNIQAAINQFFGLTAPGNTGLTPQSTNTPTGSSVLDFLSAARPATPGGGFGGAGATQTIQNMLNQDTFHGFA